MKGLGAAAGAAALALVVWSFLPPPLGAGIRPVAVASGSMAPALRQGDLAIVLPQSTYLPGQVVAYQSPDLGDRVVIHRVVRSDGVGRLVTRGDANPWTDAYRPSPEEVIGAMKLRVPQLGNLVLHPEATAAAAGGITATAAAMAARRRQRAPLLRPVLVLAPLVLGGLALTAGAALLLAWQALPPTQTVMQSFSYIHRARLDYAAPALAPVYENGDRAQAPEPLFLRLVRPVSFFFSYEAPAELHGPQGEARLYARLGDYLPTGWRRTIPIAGPVPLADGRIEMSGVLDLHQVTAVREQVAAATGLSPQAPARLEVVAEVALRGSLAGREQSDQVSFSLPFRVDETQIALEPQPQATPADLLAPRVERSLLVPVEKARLLPLLRLPIGEARQWGLPLLCAGGGLLALAALLLVGGARSPVGRLSLAGIRVVRVQGYSVPDGTPTAEMASLHELAVAARMLGAPVLLLEDGGLVVFSQGVLYRWVPKAARP